jgi:hypothetical protein
MVPGSRGKAPIVSNHHIVGAGEQEAAIGAFLVAHEGHTQDVEVRRGPWSIYCRCTSCEDIYTFEVDNEARERALHTECVEGAFSDLRLSRVSRLRSYRVLRS